MQNDENSAHGNLGQFS